MKSSTYPQPLGVRARSVRRQDFVFLLCPVLFFLEFCFLSKFKIDKLDAVFREKDAGKAVGDAVAD